MSISNEDMIEVIEALFETNWIIRGENRHIYHVIKRNEREISKHLLENYGLKLIIRSDFIKLEKIPISPKNWMGIEGFNTEMDYVLFCCAMAFTEEKGEEEAFLLNELIETMTLFYPEKDLLDWTNYSHRKSLVRVLNKMVNLRLIEVIEGNTNDFTEKKEDYEVLYKISKYSRYFIRSYPENFDTYQDGESFIVSEESNNLTEFDSRTRIFRQLLMEPVILRTTANEAEFYYLRNQKHFIESYFEKFTPFSFELTKNTAMLTLQERKTAYKTFPSLKSMDECFIQLVDIVRKENFKYNALGEITLTENQWKTLVDNHAEKNMFGWSKKEQELSREQLANKLFNLGKEWGMLVEGEVGEIVILPNFSRNIGRYAIDSDVVTTKESKKGKTDGLTEVIL
ncbi:TIGR02678 family protein [Listeria seeligeri]|uniref:TIGR02678 family protein n=1 Tax=Listeria seeligeri TaxID=1640 RepID=UPI001886D0C5|nr:TIGR02678 family protein [Listeria seeligeri]MBF2663974.1 TIGR02678 family protein [Listeria seeligeri]